MKVRWFTDTARIPQIQLTSEVIVMVTLYGIKNCDTVKKARRWLTEQNVAHRFHDFRVDGLDEQRLAAWVRQLGWETVLNGRGTTWHALSDAQRAQVVDEGSAISAMLAQPALIKRPVLETAGAVRVGFSKEEYTALLK